MKRIITIPLLLMVMLSKAQWNELGGNSSLAAAKPIFTLCADQSGNVYAGGQFTNSSGKNYVARWNKSTGTWSELGGINSLAAAGTIESICTDPSGNIYAAGGFTNGTYHYVAKWDESTNTWSELGGVNGLAANNLILSVCSDTSGNIYTAGTFTNASGKDYVAQWNKSTNTWSELGGVNTLAANSDIHSICTDRTGNVYAGGNFTNGANPFAGFRYVAQWNKSANTWSELGGANTLAANSIINTIASDPYGDIVAGGDFTNAAPFMGSYYVAIYYGGAWSGLGGAAPGVNTNYIYSLLVDNSENVYAGGAFTNASGNTLVSEWAAATGNWGELGGDNSLAANGYISALCIDPSGNIFAAGNFTNIDGNYYVAQYGNITTPVKLLSFNATRQNNNVLLQWSTAQEENSSYFNIQRSTDGKNFTNIDKVPAADNSSVMKNYSYADDKVASLNSNAIFYRLAETDIDGAITYSAIKEISFGKTNLNFTVYPNPAKDFVNITASSDISNALIQIIDMNGKMLYEANQSFAAGNQIKLSLSAFTKQVFIISVTANGRHQEFKVINE